MASSPFDFDSLNPKDPYDFPDYQVSPKPSTSPLGAGLAPSGPAPAPVSNAPSYESILRGIDPNNWVEGLRANQGALQAQGYDPWVGSGGAIRGRISTPGGGFMDPFAGGMGNTLGLNWDPEAFYRQAGVTRPAPQAAPGASGASFSAQAGGSQPGEFGGLRDALTRLIGRSEQPVGDMAGDPRAQAFSGSRQSGAQRERAKLAERAAFQGLNPGGQGSGAFETGVAGIGQQASRDIAGQQAGLVGEEMQARRDDLIRALQIASAVGARDQEAQLRLQLANMDEAFRRAQLSQQGSQFDDRFGLERASQIALLDRDAILGAAGRR